MIQNQYKKQHFQTKKELNFMNFLKRLWNQFKVLLFLVVAVLAFVFMGVFTGTENLSGGKAASVNGKIISSRDVSSRLGPQAQEGNKDFQRLFRSYILNQLINEEVLYQAMEKKLFMFLIPT